MIKKDLPYCIINRDPDSGDGPDYIEMWGDNQKLEMMAKLMAEEIVTESSKTWPGFDQFDTKCLYILPYGSADAIKQLAADYPGSDLNLDPTNARGECIYNQPSSYYNQHK